MGKKKENDGNYEYVGKGSITITPQSDYAGDKRADNKARIHRNFKRITKKGNLITIEPFTQIEEIVEDENISLKFDTKHKKVYFDGHLISFNGINYQILLKLAKAPGELVKNNVLYSYIDSDYNEAILLNQRISIIRKSFPPPYNTLKSTKCIIPDAKQNKGYRSLNLTEKQIEIS